jgi:hypothetical protein
MENGHGQIICSILLINLHLLLHTHLQPFHSPLLNKLEMLSLSSHLFLLVGVLLSAATEEGLALFIEVLVLAVALGTVVLILVALVRKQCRLDDP